jgi:hypothetical protein
MSVPEVLRRKDRLPASHQGSAWLVALVVAGAGVLAGCAVEQQNKQPAQEIAQQARRPGSVYVGWRLFQDKCVACHGSAATGTDRGPDLLPRVAEMGSTRFVNLVLRRYDWSFEVPDASSHSAQRAALIDEILRLRRGEVIMPAWQGEPMVNAHILDLYAFLKARSEGTQGPDRPQP